VIAKALQNNNNSYKVVSQQKQLDDQVTDNGINNQPSWDGSFKPTLLKDSMAHRGHINQKKAAVH
jgi:hypothetical protein